MPTDSAPVPVTKVQRARPASEAAQTNPGVPAPETGNAPRANGGQEATRRVMKALVVGPRVGTDPTTGRTKELPQDDIIDQLVAANRVLEPPFEPLVMAMLPENSTEILPSIEAMEVNCDAFGYRIDSRVKPPTGKEADEPKMKKFMEEVEKERVKLLNFFNNCCLDDSLTGMRRKTRRDLESTGNAYWEVIRSPVSGEIQGLNHIPSHQMRLGVLDESFTEFDRKILELQPGGEVKIATELAAKRFRRYVQTKIGTISRSFAQAQGYRVRWFKEFLDPRVLDNDTGEYITDAAKAKDYPKDKQASEIIHWKLYSPRTPYGLPRFIGVLLTIFGDRAAEEINFVTLKNNNIPSMAILTTGQLTEGTVGRIQEFVETQIQGSENYSRFLIIEAEGMNESGEAGGVPKLEIKPLTDQQMRDMLFQEYGKNNSQKIRRAWRLPPIFVGLTEDYNKASADTSRKLADEQVFKPERDEFDAKINKLLLPELGAVFHRFVSRGPNVTDDQDIISILGAAEKTGALTPRIAHMMLEEVLGRELPPIDASKLDPDVPFSLQMAEKVKNMSAAETTGGGGFELGNQVVAQKSLVARVLKRRLMGTVAGMRDELEDQLYAAMFGEE